MKIKNRMIQLLLLCFFWTGTSFGQGSVRTLLVPMGHCDSRLTALQTRLKKSKCKIRFIRETKKSPALSFYSSNTEKRLDSEIFTSSNCESRLKKKVSSHEIEKLDYQWVAPLNIDDTGIYDPRSLIFIITKSYFATDADVNLDVPRGVKKQFNFCGSPKILSKIKKRDGKMFLEDEEVICVLKCDPQ